MNRKRRILGLVLSLGLFVGVFVLWLHRWDLYDALRLRNYQPSQHIEQIVLATTMNSRGKHIFYVYHPELDEKNDFNTHCQNSERTIVLGCYVSGMGIYVYNVAEPRLAGVIEVTSAHEMLHAAYERLGTADKGHIDQLINKAYATVTDQRIRSTIDDYQKNGADVTNELHSILGTEVRNLPPELETYYKRYFDNRLAVVSFSERYEAVFSQRKAQVALDDQKLQLLKKQINDAQDSLASQKQTLDTLRTQLEGLLAAKQYQAYNDGVPTFNAQVNTFNTQVKSIGRMIDEYNALVAERNAIALEEGELVKAIDSRPSTIEEQ